MVSTRVDIFGRSYTIRGDAREDYIKKLASFVDKKMKEIQATAPVLTADKVAILTAVNIADELFRVKGEEEKIDKLLEQTAEVFRIMEEEKVV
jgi:cell division protein ZapA